jgi:hypothetical protein
MNMAQLADVLLVTSFILFFLAIVVGIIGPLRRALPLIHQKLRLRHLFMGSLIVFMTSFAFGWECFKAGWVECGETIRSDETVPDNQPIELSSD